MRRKLPVLILICFALFGCGKKAIPPPPQTETQTAVTEEPIYKLAQQVAEQTNRTLSDAGAKQIEVDLQNRNILPPKAFAYLQNSLIAQLGVHQISAVHGDWKLRGNLSKQEGSLTLSFSITRLSEEVYQGSARVPDDQDLRNTLAQFEEPPTTKEQDHSMHADAPIPTPLADLKSIPLDVAENCNGKDCSLLLLYSNQLVERNWRTAVERVIPLPRTGSPSRAPSGKILAADGFIWIATNNLSSPVAFDPELNMKNAAWPSRFPVAKPGLNTFTLADGEFFDFQEIGSAAMAVITAKNKLQIADRKNLLTAVDAVGGSLCVSLPYIYASSASLPGQKDSILKFRLENGVLTMEKSEPVDGSVCDIAVTDLNRDGKQEMLVTLQNERGIFIEVHEPF